MSSNVITDVRRPSLNILQLGVSLWLINPPNGVLICLLSNHLSETWDIPNTVDFFICSVANNPRPSMDDDLMVRNGGNGLYMLIYMRLDAKNLYESLF